MLGSRLEPKWLRTLFSTVPQMALKDDVTRWQKTNRMGICLGDSESDCFTNLRFADDVLLFSTSLVQLLKMMCDFKQRRKFSATNVQTEGEKWRSTALKLRYSLRARVRNILGKRLSFSNRKQQRSKVESEPPGHRSTDTNRT